MNLKNIACLLGFTTASAVSTFEINSLNSFLFPENGFGINLIACHMFKYSGSELVAASSSLSE